MAVEIYVHKMSEHMDTAQILRWAVKEGDRVQQYQVIMEVMTDKVTADLEAPAAGVVKGIRPGAVDGAYVPVGEPLGFIAGPGEEVPVLPPLPGSVRSDDFSRSAPHAGAAEAATTSPAGGVVRATPVARKLARDLGIDIALVRGTGPTGRVTEEDVRAYAQALTAAPAPPETPRAPRPESPPADDWLELNAIQRVTGERMRESILTAPQFALSVTTDMTNTLWLREALNDRVAAETGERPSVTALLVKIVAATLANHPRANAAFVAGASPGAPGRILLHHQINIGVAAGGDEGLAVPVIRDADRKSLAEVVTELNGFLDRAKTLRFTNDDLAGGTFTISNLGMYGVDQFSAIINPPQSAILAVGRIAWTPVGLPDGTIGLRPLMTLTLTVDHRVMDGIAGAKFLAELKERLEKPYFLL